MGKLLFKFFNFIGKGYFRIFYFKNVITFFNIVNSGLYSGYISCIFKLCGNNFSTLFPLYITGGDKITIGNNFSSFRRNRIEVFGKILDIEYDGQLSIGDNFSINDDCHIACINKITIGNNVLFASKIFVTDHFHGKIDKESLSMPPSLRPLFSKGEVVIEDNVWVGEGVVILPGVSIGQNSVIGANSVVTKSFPKNSVIGGNPARLIKII
jgi:acetyltransferase-like isoleucine patch superfamily enzyme